MKAKPTRRQVLQVLGAGAATSIIPVGVADCSSSWLEVVYQNLLLSNWDASGFRMVVLSDLHVNTGRQTDLAAMACTLAVDENPDMIAIPGDFVNFSDPGRLQNIRAALHPLREAKCPVFATLGNHDYWTRRPQAVIETIRAMGIRVLRNEAVECNGVSVGGVDDAIANLHRPEFLGVGNLSRSLIALFHEPDFVTDIPSNVSLMVSGHSHGGQICLPGGIALHTPRGARNYIAGFYPEARVPLYVSRGVGTVGPQMRLFCRPEVTVLTLNPAA